MSACQEPETYVPPGRGEKVPNAPLRARFEKLGVSASEVALAAGWTRSQNDPRPNVVRVQRALGLIPHNQGRTTDTVTYVAAVALARALDLDPIDAGV